ncbi:MAG: tetratricopeptide repeat protein [Planctomycetota bacterium]|nr:tetratricopeptide repeat protein [Planctomycetota bacterium]
MKRGVLHRAGGERRLARVLLAAALVAMFAGGCVQRRQSIGPTNAERTRAMQLASDAVAAAKKDDHTRAIELNRQALEADPELAAAWHNLGTSLLSQQKYGDAQLAFERAAELSPTDPRPYANLGVLYREAGWYKDALRYFDQALEREPTHLESLRGAVRTALELGQFDQKTLDRARQGMKLETDQAWRGEFERAMVRLESEEQARETTLR